MYSFRENDPQEEQFTLRVTEKPQRNICKTVSSTCHPLIYSMRNDTMIKSHNNFTTKYDICYDDSSVDPPNKYLTDYARAIAICEDFFVKTPLKQNDPKEYKEVLLEILKYEFTPSFDCVLLSQIGNYIDYYLNKEKVNNERLCFKLQSNKQDTIRDNVLNLKEQVAVMDLDYGYNHFAIRKKRKLKQKRIHLQDNCFNNNNNLLVTISDNSDTRKTSQSLEKNILLKHIIQKENAKGLSRNNSQPVINLKSSYSNGNALLNSSCNNELNQLQTKNSTVHNLNETNLKGNCNTIISNIFTSIYKPTPKIFIHKHKLSDKRECRTLNTVYNDNNVNNNSLMTLSNQRSFNKSTNTLRNIDHTYNKVKVLPKLPSFFNCNQNDRYNKLSANASLQNLNSKDNRLVSSLRSNTTNNTLTMMKTTTKRNNSQTRNYSKETNEHLVKTSMHLMKQYQNSLRKDTSVPNYKPNKKKITKMAPLPVPRYNKHKEIIPYVYHINKKPIMHLKDYAIKKTNPFTNNNNSNLHQNRNEKEERYHRNMKLKSMFISLYLKLNHNTLLLILFKTATAYNKSLNLNRKKKTVLCSNNNNKRNVSRNSKKCEENISVKEKSDKSQRTLNHNRSMQSFKSFTKNTNNMNQRFPFK